MVDELPSDGKELSSGEQAGGEIVVAGEASQRKEGLSWAWKMCKIWLDPRKAWQMGGELQARG